LRDNNKTSLISKKKKKSLRSRAHARTTRTYLNKLNKLTSQYNRLYHNSLKAKEVYLTLPEVKRPKCKKFFCDNYSTQESFLKNYKLKEAGKERESGSSFRKTTVLGMS